MEIKYLKILRDNPIHIGNGATIRGLSLSDITALEQIYNNGNPFPEVVKELLFLAGDNCYVLDFGGLDSLFTELGWAKPTLAPEIQMTQILVVDNFQEDSVPMPNRPLLFLDIYDESNPLFVFLDEGNDPNLYYYDMQGKVNENARVYPNDPYIGKVLSPLSLFIKTRVQFVLDGRNPF